MYICCFGALRWHSHHWACDVTGMNFAITRNVRSWVGENVDMRHKLREWTFTIRCWLSSFLFTGDKCFFSAPPSPLYGFPCLEPRLGPVAHLDHQTSAGKGEGGPRRLGKTGRRRRRLELWEVSFVHRSLVCSPHPHVFGFFHCGH